MCRTRKESLSLVAIFEVYTVHSLPPWEHGGVWLISGQTLPILKVGRLITLTQLSERSTVELCFGDVEEKPSLS